MTDHRQTAGKFHSNNRTGLEPVRRSELVRNQSETKHNWRPSGTSLSLFPSLSAAVCCLALVLDQVLRFFSFSPLGSACSLQVQSLTSTTHLVRVLKVRTTSNQSDQSGRSRPELVFHLFTCKPGLSRTCLWNIFWLRFHGNTTACLLGVQRIRLLFQVQKMWNWRIPADFHIKPRVRFLRYRFQCTDQPAWPRSSDHAH